MRLRSPLSPAPPLETPVLPPPSVPLSEPRAFSLRDGFFFLLAYPEDFLRRATRFCYINIGSISKRTPFYQAPFSSPPPVSPPRGFDSGCTAHEIYANWNGVSRIRWKLFNVDNVIRNRAGANCGGCVRGLPPWVTQASAVKSFRC